MSEESSGGPESAPVESAASEQVFNSSAELRPTEAAIPATREELVEADREARKDDIWNEMQGELPDALKADDPKDPFNLDDVGFEDDDADAEMDDEFVETDEVEHDELEADDPDVKKLKLITADGEEVEVPADAMINIKVDGVDQQVSMQDFANGISGEKAIAQRFNMLNEDKKQFQQQTQQWNDTEKKFRGLMENGRTAEALGVIFDTGGYHSESAFVQLFEEMLPQLQQYANLAPEQRKAYSEQMKAERNRMQAETAQKELALLRAEKEQLTRVRQVQQTHGLDDGRFVELYQELKSTYKGTITPEIVGEYNQILTRESWVKDTLKSISPGLVKDNTALYDVLSVVNSRVRSGQTLSENDVKALTTNLYGAATKNKAAQVQKNLRKKGNNVNVARGKSPSHQVNHQGHNSDKPGHWMDAFVKDLDSAGSAGDTSKVFKKWQKPRQR